MVLSDPSRTFVDCLDRPDHAGGWEEVLRSLEGLPNVRGGRLLHTLDTLGRKVLYRKAGLVLELMEGSPYYEGVLDDVGEALLARTQGSPMRMDQRSRGPLNRRWNLYTVEGLSSMLVGV